MRRWRTRGKGRKKGVLDGRMRMWRYIKRENGEKRKIDENSFVKLAKAG